MNRRPTLSKGELEVARTVWKLGEATVGQIHEAMPKSRAMNYATVQTYIRRLEEKGYLKARRDGRTKIYSAKVKPGKVIGETVRNVMDQLFDGEIIPMVKHMVSDRQISDEELEQLREIIDEAEQNNADND